MAPLLQCGKTFAARGKLHERDGGRDENAGGAMPTLEDWQHWTLVMGRAQQMLMEFWAEQPEEGPAVSGLVAAARSAFGERRRGDATRWR